MRAWTDVLPATTRSAASLRRTDKQRKQRVCRLERVIVGITTNSIHTDTHISVHLLNVYTQVIVFDLELMKQGPADGERGRYTAVRVHLRCVSEIE